jgi:hypothetical protein
MHPPPLSHMMKTARRNSDLPSLSISIPPVRQPSDQASRIGSLDNDSRRLAQPVHNPRERTKTVTFSDLDDEDLSDQSSICHSPSWEGFRQSNKKSKKKEAEKKRKEQQRLAKEAAKPTQNRLSKNPPQQRPEPRKITSQDRSLSAPEIQPRHRHHERTPSRSNYQYPPNSMANPHNMMKHASTDDFGKPKPKGFLSGFRLQHGNVSTVQKMMANPPPNAEDNDSMRSGFSFPLHNQGPVRGEMDFLNPRKPPSIKSTQSTSTQSMSSQEKRSGGHSRSSSLLSKLKGPLYLYAQTSEPTESTGSKHANVSGRASSMSERPLPSQNPSPQPFDFDLPPASSKTEAQRVRERDLHYYAAEARSSSDYDDSSIPEFRESRVKGKEDATDIPVANECRRRPQADSQPVRYQLKEVILQDTSSAVNEYAQEPRRCIQEAEHTYPHLQQPSRVQSQVIEMGQTTPVEVPSPTKDYAAAYTEEVDRLSISHSPHDDNVDHGSIGTHTSTIRSGSQDKLHNSGESRRKHPPYPASKSNLGGSTFLDNSVEEELEEPAQSLDAEMDETTCDNTIKLAVDDHASTGEKPVDYFAFISESYAPPPLDLRSPTEQQFPKSPRIEEEPDEEDDDPEWTILPIQSPSQSTESSTDGFVKAKSNPPLGPGRKLKPFELQDSPAMSATQSDSDIPSLEHLIRLPEVNKNIGKTKPSITSRSFEDQPSRSTSERSSSSTCDDVQPSSSAATTPDGSRPQSQRGVAAEIPRSVPSVMKPVSDERTPRKPYRSMGVDLPVRSSARSASRDGSRPPPVSMENFKNSVANAGNQDALGLPTPSPSLIVTPTSTVSVEAVEASETAEVGKEGLQKEDQPSRTPTRRMTLPPKAYSAVDLTATDFLPPLKHQPLQQKPNKAGATSSVSLPNSPPPELEVEQPIPLRPALKTSKSYRSSSQDRSGALSAGGVYLKAARKSVPVPPSSSRALRSLPTKNSTNPNKSGGSGDRMGEPIAKVLVECCSCKFLHDMPSRVYECIAKPDSFVEDKMLGVSAAITTMVKCPWCAHGMTTQCCAGYAAMVYLKEKLHGK